MAVLTVDGDSERTTTLDLVTSLPWVDVRAFSAVGDGVTDDTNAIKAAIAYAVSLRQAVPGLTRVYDQVPPVMLPRGKYLVTEKHALDPVLAVAPDPVESLR